MSTVYVHTSHATINVGSDASYVITGDDDTVWIGGDSTVTATGSALLIEAAAAGDVVTVGGNGKLATDVDDDVVLFQAPGVLHELVNSRVDSNADNSRFTMAGADTLGVYGSGDLVTALAAGDGVWIGQNGEAATGAAIDRVQGLFSGTLFALQGSHIAVNGEGFTATMSGDDAMTAIGSDIDVFAFDKNNVLDIGSDGFAGTATASFNDPGTINALAQSSVRVFGDELLVHVAAGDVLQLVGSADQAACGAGCNITVGSLTDTSPDVVSWAYYPGTPIDVLSRTNVRLVGQSGIVSLQGDDRVVVAGSDEDVTDLVGGNRIAIGGNHKFPGFDLDNVVNVTSGDTVAELANSEVSVAAAAPDASGLYAVSMSSDDLLLIGSGMRVFVPKASADDALSGFGPSDAVTLGAHFASVGALLSATTDDFLGATIHFDAADSLKFYSVDKAALTAYANEGLIKFA